MDIVGWLCAVEEKVGDIYRRAAENFAADAGLAGLLRTLSEQEMRHAEILRQGFAGSSLDEKEDMATIVDPETRHGVMTALDDIMGKIVAGGVSREAMVEMIVDTEYHEWNGIFLYAMQVLKKSGSAYSVARREIETHLQDIESFLVSFSYGRQVLERLRQLPPLERLKVLVVEDDPALAALIKSILLREADVTVVVNGRLGLEQLRGGGFDVILSDVDMPVMDGIDLYIQAHRLGLTPKGRYIFMSANLRPDHRRFLAEQKVTVLRKPSPINRIRQAVFGGSEPTLGQLRPELDQRA